MRFGGNADRSGDRESLPRATFGTGLRTETRRHHRLVGLPFAADFSVHFDQ